MSIGNLHSGDPVDRITWFLGYAPQLLSWDDLTFDEQQTFHFMDKPDNIHIPRYFRFEGRVFNVKDIPSIPGAYIVLYIDHGAMCVNIPNSPCHFDCVAFCDGIELWGRPWFHSKWDAYNQPMMDPSISLAWCGQAL